MEMKLVVNSKLCGGGTTSRCAATGHWTLDFRKKYKEIKFDFEKN